MTSALLASLARLDERLLSVAGAARARTGREPGSDPFRGLYVSESDFFNYLCATSAPWPTIEIAPLAQGNEFDNLARLYRLSSFELDVLLVAMAPEIDPRYERIFGYLQDDVSRRRPCGDLALSLFCTSPPDRLKKRAALSETGALVRERLIRLSGDDSIALPGRELCIDSRIASFLLGESTIDPRLGNLAALIEPQSGEAHSGLVDLIRSSAPAPIYFRGADEEVKRSAAASLARELHAPLLGANTGRAARRAGFDSWLEHLVREARLRGAMIFHEGADSLDEHSKEAVLNSFATTPVILSGTQEWKGDALTVPFDAPDWRERRHGWESNLRLRGIPAANASLDTLAESFRFSAAQISSASTAAIGIACFRREKPRVSHVFEAARARSGNELASLARKVPSARTWGDLVLPESSVAQLHEVARRVTLRHRVLEEWGFGRRLSGGKGVNALFHGHSGTGKTMAAEVIARELELDLFKIDLAGVVSKYIGETEKNLERIFSAAEKTNVILLFDEADALFGKRSEVRDSHDRYANLEVSYLLQKMEAYEGLSILATNLRQNLDDAFLRRLAFVVPFPFPDESSRRRIWQAIWPADTPLDRDIDSEFLGDRFVLSGGNIRNAAVGAAYLAAQESRPVSMDDVLAAVRAEFSKMGKTLSADELARPAEPPNYSRNSALSGVGR